MYILDIFKVSAMRYKQVIRSPVLYKLLHSFTALDFVGNYRNLDHRHASHVPETLEKRRVPVLPIICSYMASDDIDKNNTMIASNYGLMFSFRVD